MTPKKFRDRKHIADCMREGRKIDGPMRRHGFFDFTDRGKIRSSCPMGYALIGLYGKEELERYLGTLQINAGMGAKELLTASMPDVLHPDHNLDLDVIGGVDNLEWTTDDALDFLEGATLCEVTIKARKREAERAAAKEGT